MIRNSFDEIQNQTKYDINILERSSMGDQLNGNTSVLQQNLLEIPIRQSLAHTTTFGPNQISQMYNNTNFSRPFVNDTEKQIKSLNPSQEGIIINQSTTKDNLQESLQNNQQLRQMPKFMEYGQNGQLKMKRVLYLVDKNIKKNVKEQSNSDDTSSIHTDSSMQSFDHNSQMTQINQENNQDFRKLRLALAFQFIMQSKDEKPKIFDILKQKISSLSLQVNQIQQMKAQQVNLKQQIPNSKNYQHKLQFTQVSETDEEFSRSHQTKNTGPLDDGPSNSQDLNLSRNNNTTQQSQAGQQKAIISQAQNSNNEPYEKKIVELKPKYSYEQLANLKRNRHSMLVQVRKGDGKNELEQSIQMSKLSTQLYKFNNDVASSLIGGMGQNFGDNSQKSESTQLENQQQIFNQMQGNQIQPPFQNHTQFQKAIQQQWSNNKQQMPQNFNQHLSQQLQQNHQHRSHSKLVGSASSNVYKGPRSNKTLIKTDDYFSNRKGGNSSIVQFNKSSQDTINDYQSQVKSHTSSVILQQQNASRRRITQSPLKLQHQKLTDITKEVSKIEQLYRSVFFPSEIAEITNLKISPTSQLKLNVCNEQDNFSEKKDESAEGNNFYDANTIKEATEDQEQSSKGGSIAFKSKGLFFNKAQSLVSQKDKRTEQNSVYLNAENPSSPMFKQSLSFNQSRKIINSNLEQEDKLEDSVNLDDISEININFPSVNKDKRFSNPDPNDRKIRRLETLIAGNQKLSQHPEAKALLKQLTQTCKSPKKFSVHFNEDQTGLQTDTQARNQLQVSNQNTSELKKYSINSRNTSDNLSDLNSQNRNGPIIYTENFLQIGNSPTQPPQTPPTAQFRQRQGSGSKFGSNATKQTEQQQASQFYRFSHSQPNIFKENLIKRARKILKKFQITQDSQQTTINNILDLVQKKIYYEYLKSSMGQKNQHQNYINEMQNSNQECLNEVSQKLQNEILLQNQIQKNEDSTPSAGRGVRISFETNAVNQFNFPEVYNVYHDDFTPSHCYAFEPISTSSDLFSSANNFLSQLEPFNPNNYEMEIIQNSEAASMLASLNQTTSMQNQWINNPNQKNYQDLNKSIKNFKNIPSGFSPHSTTVNQNKIIPENFTQVNMIIEENWRRQQHNQNQNQRNQVLSPNSSITDNKINILLKSSINESQHDRQSNINESQQTNNIPQNRYEVQEQQQAAQALSNTNKFNVNVIREFNQVQITPAKEINLVQPSRRHSTTNSQSNKTDHSAGFLQGSIDKTNTARSNIKEVKIEENQPLDLHPNLKVFLNQNQTSRLQACIPRPLSSTQIYQQDRQENSKFNPGGHVKLIDSVSQNINQRIQNGITLATDAQYLNRRINQSTQRSISVSQQMSPKKPHISITTTSLISSKQRGITRINQYQMLKKLGEGKYSKVKLCVDVNTNKYYAVKIMDKIKLQRKIISRVKNAYSNVQQEMAIMKKLDHPHLVKLFEIIDDPKANKLYLITEFVQKGNLEKKVKTSPQWLEQTENDTMRKIFRQLIQAVEYCHEVVKILHRDIKPENILIDQNDDIKLADFGVSSLLPQDGNDYTSVNAGSAIFFSPQACQGQQYHGRLTDYWACGVTLYYMCTGKFPFVSNDMSTLFNKIQFAQVEFPQHLQGTQLANLISGLLQKKEEERLKLSEIKTHPWVTKQGVLGPINNIELEEQILIPSQEEVENTFGKVESRTRYQVRRKSTKQAQDSKSQV